jgi:hypothetical protein
VPADLNELAQKAAARLLAALAPKGARAGAAPDVVELGFGELQAKCVVFEAVEQQPSGWGLALGVEVSGPDLDKPVRDSGGARGATLDEAVDGAVQAWVAGLHVPLRDALGDDAVPYRYSITQTNSTTGESNDWSTFESPLHIGGAEESHEKLWDLLKDPPIFGRFIQAGLLPPLVDGDLHWLRLDAVGDGGKTVQIRGSFDGGPWPGVEKLFADLQWPSPGLQMFRQYWVLIAN